MKSVWINDDLYEVYAKASKKVGRPVATTMQLILTSNINTVNDPEKLNKLFSMVKDKG